MLLSSKKAFMLALGFAATAMFSGCAKDGLAINTMGGNRVDRMFINGTVELQQKVIIDDREKAALMGASIGGIGTAVAVGGNKVKGGLAGAVIGGIAGALIGNEVEAYKTTVIGDDGRSYMGYLTQALPQGSRLEFTVVDDKLKNVNVLSVPRQTSRAYGSNTRAYPNANAQTYSRATTTRNW